MEEIKTKNEKDTFNVGKKLATQLEAGSIVTLEGPLGAGKTVLTKGIASGLGIDPQLVNSPTFTLLNIYSSGKLPLYHFDWYRLKSKAELLETGCEEYLFGNGISVIEWYKTELMELNPTVKIELQYLSSSSFIRALRIFKS